MKKFPLTSGRSATFGPSEWFKWVSLEESPSNQLSKKYNPSCIFNIKLLYSKIKGLSYKQRIPVDMYSDNVNHAVFTVLLECYMREIKCIKNFVFLRNLPRPCADMVT